MVKPYPDGFYCSKICQSQCCRNVDIYVLKSEEISYEFWKANYPSLGRKTCGCLDAEGLCSIHEGPRPLICRIYPYFIYQGGIMASLNCKYVSEVVLPSLTSHVVRDRVFKQILEYLTLECSDEQVVEIEDRLRQCKGVFLLFRGNLDG